MRFEWGARKSESNIAKHGIDFAEAPRLFSAPMQIVPDTRQDYGEDRWIGLGMLDGRVVAMVFTEPDEETTRIISIRRALPQEQKHYERYIRQFYSH